MSEIPDFVQNAEYRRPIMDLEGYKELPFQEAHRVWDVLTTHILRKLPEDEKLQRIVAEFTDTGFGERLAKDFVDSIQVLGESDPRISRLLNDYSRSEILHGFLELPAFPEKLLSENIRSLSDKSAPGYPVDDWHDRYKAIKNLASEWNRTFDRENLLKRQRENFESGEYKEWATWEEFLMVTDRYKMARDVRFLAIASQLLNYDLINLREGENHVNGVDININPSRYQEVIERGLLDPGNWEKFFKVDDRVRFLQLQSDAMVLKEEKGTTHSRTMAVSVPKLSAAEEYDMTKYLAENAKFSTDDYRVSFENPLFIIDDGNYKFIAFDKLESGNTMEVMDQYRQAILANREKFQDEYRRMRVKASVWMPDAIKVSARRPIRRVINSIKSRRKLTFEEYARVKSWFVLRKAYGRMISLRLEHEIVNRDHTSFVGTVDEDTRLHLIGIDAEYFREGSKEELEDTRQKITSAIEANEKYKKRKWEYPYLKYDKKRKDKSLKLKYGTIAEHACYIAMLGEDEEGLFISNHNLLDEIGNGRGDDFRIFQLGNRWADKLEK